jgi:hypothetical protein
MRSRKWYDRNRWSLSNGLPELRPWMMPHLEELKVSEWDERFDRLAKGKLIHGAYRYGLLKENNNFDFIESMKTKIARYEKAHNLELLVDIRNYAMLEFLKPKYNDAYYHNEDDTEHAILKKNGNRT